jgi:glycine cleavage system H lipoate-binding protein
MCENCNEHNPIHIDEDPEDDNWLRTMRKRREEKEGQKPKLILNE